MSELAIELEPGEAPQPIWVALGSNRGDRERSLREATEALKALGCSGFRASSLWETEPIDVPFGGRFLNAAVVMEGANRPFAWLRRLQALERRFGRRAAGRNLPRALDLDLLAIGSERVRHPLLELPHPRLHRRAFVLAPLAELVPDARIAPDGPTIVEMLREADAGGIQRVGSLAAPESLPV